LRTKFNQFKKITKKQMNTKKNKKKRKELPSALEQITGRGFVLGIKVAGMFSYSIFFRGYALFMDAL